METLEDASGLLGEPDQLRRELREQGFLMMRGVLDVEQVRAAGLACVAAINDEGIPVGTAGNPYYFEWDRVPDDYATKRVAALHRMYGLECVTAIFHSDPLVTIGRLLTGEHDTLVNPRKEVRFQPPVRPGSAPQTTGAHQDHMFNQGSTEMFTVWVPLAETPAGMGGLELLQGSNKRGLIEDGSLEEGAITYTIEKRSEDGEWYRPSYRLGDCVFFHSLTVHRASVNTSDRVRLSADCRYQGYSQPFAKELLTPLPGVVESYPNWSRKDLQNYWQDPDLITVPWEPWRIPGYPGPAPDDPDYPKWLQETLG